MFKAAKPPTATALKLLTAALFTAVLLTGFVTSGFLSKSYATQTKPKSSTTQTTQTTICPTPPPPAEVFGVWTFPPKLPRDVRVARQLTITTSCGPITVEFYRPRAANAFSAKFLSTTDFLNTYNCPALTTAVAYLVWCGSNSNPGYTLPAYDTPDPSDVPYPAGTLAYDAYRGKTTGKWFFTYQDTFLPPDYPIVGRVVEGLDILVKIGQGGTTDGQTNGPARYPITFLSSEVHD